MTGIFDKTGISSDMYQGQRFGVPYMGDILGSGSSDALIYGIFRRAIQSIPGISDVTSITWRRNVFEASGFLSFMATTDQGVVLTVKDLRVPFIAEKDLAERA